MREALPGYIFEGNIGAHSTGSSDKPYSLSASATTNKRMVRLTATIGSDMTCYLTRAFA